MKLGLFGGTFDPVHRGHLAIARRMLRQLKLDAVIWIPTARASTHRTGQPHILDAQRIALLRAAIRGNKKFRLDLADVRAKRPTYTINTVRRWRRKHPRAQLYWLLGTDHLSTLAQWRQFPRLCHEVTFVVAPR